MEMRLMGKWYLKSDLPRQWTIAECIGVDEKGSDKFVKRAFFTQMSSALNAFEKDYGLKGKMKIIENGIEVEKELVINKNDFENLKTHITKCEKEISEITKTINEEMAQKLLEIETENESLKLKLKYAEGKADE